MRTIGLLSAFLVLAGCAQTHSAGTEFSASAASTIVVGKSSKEAVRAALGEPMQQTLLPNNEDLWIYSYAKIETGGNAGTVAGGAAGTAALGAGTAAAVVALGPVGMIPAAVIGPSLYTNAVMSSVTPTAQNNNSLQITFKNNVVKNCIMTTMESKGQSYSSKQTYCKDLTAR